MWPPSFSTKRTPLLLAGLLASGLLLAGCDEHVDVVRDHSVAIPKGATWAWKPAEAHDKNEVVSRDRMSRNGVHETISRDSRADNETLRLEIRTDIEQTLSSKGFREVSDPLAADFLVDYHVGIRRHTFNAERGGYRRGYDDGGYGRGDGRGYDHDDDYDYDRGYEGGYRGYPGLICGPFGCWASYTWGYGGSGEYGYENFREGTIVFDFIKQKSDKIAFRAVAHKRMTHNSFHSDQVRDAVQRLLRDLKHGR